VARSSKVLCWPYRNLRKIRFDVVFGLRQTECQSSGGPRGGL
jgi:hypothetical protein